MSDPRDAGAIDPAMGGARALASEAGAAPTTEAAGAPAIERAPTPEQRAAIEARGRDVLLEAGAGSGKTGGMVERYVRLVVDEGISPAAVLPFTFPDKAAAELRARVRAELSRRAAADSGAKAVRAAALLATIGGAWI